MEAVRALEIAGTIDEHRQLHLDEPLPDVGPSRVRVIILISEEELMEADDIDEGEWLRWMAHNPAYEFLDDPAEDIYTLEDGKPYHAEG